MGHNQVYGFRFVMIFFSPGDFMTPDEPTFDDYGRQLYTTYLMILTT